MPLTEETPKPLIPIQGKPVLQHVIDLYEKKGLKEFVLCIGHKGHLIKEHFKGKNHKVTFSESGEDASMLKRIWDTKDQTNGRMMISYADTITDIDLNDLIKYHEAKKSIATILVAKIKSPFGLVFYDDAGKCTSFEEKPILNYYIGHIIFENDAFKHITPDLLAMKDGEGLVTFFKKLSKMGLLHVYEHKGLQITFNTNAEKENAEKELIQFYTYKEE